MCWTHRRRTRRGSSSILPFETCCGAVELMGRVEQCHAHPDPSVHQAAFLPHPRKKTRNPCSAVRKVVDSGESRTRCAERYVVSVALPAKQARMLDILSRRDGWITAAELAHDLGVTTRSIRTYVA